MKKKVNKKVNLAQLWENRLMRTLTVKPWVVDSILGGVYKPHKETKREKEARLKREQAEKRRRAKKITMTVGEYEDKLEEERDKYSDY